MAHRERTDVTMSMNSLFIFDIIYALAARDGREKVLFGETAPAAREAFVRSLPSDAFPELWFELPLLGEPWFDLHALTSVEHLSGQTPPPVFTDACTGGHPRAFAWFAEQGAVVRQLALSWDVGSGDASIAAVQLLLAKDSPETTCEFLEAAGRGDAAPAYRTFWSRLPENWFACYTGVFPERPGHNLRVECIPNRELQMAYAQDEELLARHLSQVGLSGYDDTLLSRCVELARTPFQLEFQFDVDEEGAATSTFSASVRFAMPSEAEHQNAFDPNGAAGELLERVEEWGLADGRWRQLEGAMFAKRISRGDESVFFYCYPAFVKLRWRDGKPFDAKTYIIAGIQ